MRAMFRGPLLVGLLLCMCRLARAGEPPKATLVGQGKLLIPSLQLSASTDDKATFKIAAGYILPSDSRVNYILWPRLQVASSSGVSKLFSTTGSESLPWEVGLGLTIVVPGGSSLTRENDADLNAAKVSAFNTCAVECAGQDSCKFKVSAAFEDKTKVTPEDLCPAGQEVFLRYEATIPGRRSFPALRISLGTAAGRSKFKFLDGMPGNGIDRVDRSEIHASSRAGASLLFVPADTTRAGQNRAFTLEGRVLYTNAWNSASDTVRWCQPEGNVPAAPGSTVELCQDRALGAPGNPRSLALGASFGIGDTAKQFWRASLGAFADLDLGGGTTDFGVEIPIYLSFASGSAPVGYAGDYKGVLRVGPRLQWTKSSNGSYSAEFFVVVDALAQHSIFSEVLD
jgi:hypothetical protein